MKNDILNTAGAATKGIETKKKKDRHSGCKSISCYISLAQNVLISLGGGTVNKIDHYKIHEVQIS